MDKVIIDGVDVSECPNFKADICSKSCKLSVNEKCNYKQLKRLQAENETLERTNNELRKRFSEDTTKLSAELKELQGKYNGLNANYNSLKFENERLKEENNELCKRMAEVTYRVTGGRLSYPNYTLDAIEQAFYDQLEILSDQKSEEYKQALQEIRDMAEKMYNTNDEDVERDLYIKLQDKINEVIGAE